LINETEYHHNKGPFKWLLNGQLIAQLSASGFDGQLVGQSINVKGSPYFAKGDGVTDDTLPIAAAIAAARSGPPGTSLHFPDGNYLSSSTLSPGSYVRLTGNGSGSSHITYSGTASAVKFTDGVSAGLRGLKIICSNGGANVIALHLKATTSNPQQPQVSKFHDVYLEASNLVAGQIGLYLDASDGGSSQSTFGQFSNFTISNFDRPQVETGGNEGNIFANFHILGLGAAAGTAYGVESASNLSQYLGYDFRLGGSAATTLAGFRLTGEGNIAFGVADLGAGGSLYSVTGSDNEVFGWPISPSGFGTISGGYSKPLGRFKAGAGGYEVTALSTTGSNRSVFQAGVSGYSNGYTVEYQHSPQAMRYVFADGPVGFGTTPAFAGALGPYTRVIATASLPGASANNDGLMVIEDAGAGDRNLIIYAGGQRFRIDGGAAF
jgi:hypothetical protein